MEKINQAITKLQKTIIEAGLIYLYFNTYLLKSVFFRCRVVNLSVKQQTKLQKKYEGTIIQKNKT